MEEKEKVQPALEPNPNGEDEEVDVTDITDGGEPSGSQADEGKRAEGEGNPKPDGGGKPAPRQTRETDAQNAERRRREKERAEQRQREREAEIRRQAVFEVKSGQVSAEELRELGLAKVETEDQLYLVESLRKAKADGAENPIADAYRALYGKNEAEKAKAEEAKKEEDKAKAIVAKDQAAFKAKFGKTTAEVYKNEEEFMSIFGGLIDVSKGNFTELYSAYIAMKGEHKDAAKKAGSFPTSAQGGGKPNPAIGETDEQFKERWKREHGRW